MDDAGEVELFQRREMAMQVRVARAAMAEVRRVAVAAFPEEGCGILLGRWSGETIAVTRAVMAANVAAERRRRYALDPRAILQATADAERAGEAVVGFFHSHPDGTAAPSATDLAEAHPWVLYMIAGVSAGEVTALRAWWAVGERAESGMAARFEEAALAEG